MNRAIFLDRDGVINHKAPDGEYITDRSELILLPGVLEAVRKIKRARFLMIIVTNQRGVARQKIDAAELDGIHRQLRDQFSAAGAAITGIYVCPHEGGCECRKPAPGMLLRAAAEHEIDLHSSWVIGDSASDIEAGKRAGCGTVWIKNGASELPCESRPDMQAENLPAAIEQILRSGAKVRSPRKQGSSGLERKAGRQAEFIHGDSTSYSH